MPPQRRRSTPFRHRQRVLRGGGSPGARLEGAFLSGAQLKGADLREAPLEGACLQQGAAGGGGPQFGAAGGCGPWRGAARGGGPRLGAPGGGEPRRVATGGGGPSIRRFSEIKLGRSIEPGGAGPVCGLSGREDLTRAQLDQMIGNAGTLLPDTGSLAIHPAGRPRPRASTPWSSASPNRSSGPSKTCDPSSSVPRARAVAHRHPAPGRRALSRRPPAGRSLTFARIRNARHMRRACLVHRLVHRTSRR